MHDLAIIGSGPAGMAAAIYATRARLDAIVIEQNFMGGGQIINTYDIDNYPAIPGISGFDLASRMSEHAAQLGAHTITATVAAVEAVEGGFSIQTGGDAIEARAIVIACGADHSKLGVPGEEEFAGRGVSYCATCDGAFFKDRDVVVVGGGDVACGDAIFLSRICHKVTVVHRRGEMRAAKSLQETLFAQPNVEMAWNTVVERIEGDSKVSGAVLKDVASGETRTLSTGAVFVAVGIVPNSQPFAGFVERDARGYIIAGEDGATNVPGVFAAGDVRTKALRQIVTAVADGANAVTAAQEYLAATA